MIEESIGVESARSAYSVSASMDKAARGKKQKSVQFDDSVKERMSASGEKWHHSSVQNMDDDIHESIKIAESLSHSMRS